MILLKVCANINAIGIGSVGVGINIIVYGNVGVFLICDVLQVQNKPSILQITINSVTVSIHFHSNALKYAMFLSCFCYLKIRTQHHANECGFRGSTGMVLILNLGGKSRVFLPVIVLTLSTMCAREKPKPVPGRPPQH